MSQQIKLHAEHRRLNSQVESVRFNDKWPILCIFAVSLSWALYTATIGWNHTLSDMHAFRQTQTAITSYYFMQGGPFLRYETPIVGAPWSIPFEFPLYQWIVAAMATTFHTALEPTGRFVNELFFALSLFIIWTLLSEFGIRRLYRLIFLTLMLVSPQYVFWSRTFMIESTALFFCLAYLLFFVRYIRTHRAVNALLGSLCGILGALVKVTTFPSFLLVGTLLYAFSLGREHKFLRSPAVLLRHAFLLLTLTCLPILAAWEWTYFADQVKAQNTVGAGLTSARLWEWNFGSLDQRFQVYTWMTLVLRTIPDLLGNSVFAALPLCGLFFARRRLVPFLICIYGFLSVFLIFTNLHVIHNYYAYANGLFFVAAISWCIVGLLESKKWHQVLGVTIFLIVTSVCIAGYYGRAKWFSNRKSEYSVAQKKNRVDMANIAQVVKNATQPHDIILVFGLDWSAELPFYSQRRALMWPNWIERNFDAPGPMREALSKLGNHSIGALVLCQQAQTDADLLQRSTSTLGFADVPIYEDWTCSLYSSQTFSTSTSGTTSTTSTIAPPSNVPANYGGAVDRVDCDGVSGWVWNSANPTARIKVELYIDDQFADTQPARNPRPDLSAGNLGTGNYGFVFKIPPSFMDGKAHAVRVIVAGSNYTLKIYERAQSTFNCEP